MTSIPLGYEVGTGEAVEIPVKHMAITGMSQEAGKTTALEGLIARSGLRAVTFITKRGEGSFGGGRRLAPFFRERADWVFVSSLIDATLGEKNKLLRAWLMKVCRGTRTLSDVQRNVVKAKADARGFSESIYTEIEGYLELVVPQLAQLPPAGKVEIGPGLNVMDLSPYAAQLQGLVIRSVIEHVYERETDVITVIPEAWEFLPEGRGSPVKLAAETLIRKGAALRNFMWMDSQDLGGVWKLVVRACPIVLVGIQREANEIKRTLANIPAGVPRLTPADVATLGLGQFYACWGKHAVKTYVQPAWLNDEDAQAVATGDGQVVARHFPSTQQTAIGGRSQIDALGRAFESAGQQEETVTHDEAARLTRENEQLKADNTRLRNTIAEVERQANAIKEDLERRLKALEGDRAHDTRRTTVGRSQPAGDGDTTGRPRDPAPARPAAAAFPADEEARYQSLKARLLSEASQDPVLLKVLQDRPELEVVRTRRTLEVEGDSLKGRLAGLIAEGFFDDAKKGYAAFMELLRLGAKVAKPGVYGMCDQLTKEGFLTKESDGYRAAAGMKVRIVEQQGCPA